MLVHWYIGSGGLIWSFNCKPFHGRLRHTAAQEKMVHWYIGPAAMYQVKQAQCTNCQKPFEWISSRTDNAGGRQGLEVGTLVHWASSGTKVGRSIITLGSSRLNGFSFERKMLAGFKL